MRMLAILLLCVTPAAATEVDTVVEAFPVPDWYKAYGPSDFTNASGVLPPDFPEGAIPKHMGAWPKGADGRPVPAYDNVIQSDAGSCEGLTKIKSMTTEKECEEGCLAEPLCPSFQFSTDDGCFMGAGTTCLGKRTDLTNMTAGRVRHGAVIVLADLKAENVQIKNLIAVDLKEPDGSLPNASYAAEFCKEYCYSILQCQYWQYFSQKGCWIDDGTVAGLRDGKLDASDFVVTRRLTDLDEMLAGEFVQHYWLPAPTTVVTTAPPTTTTEAPPNLTWLWVLLGVIGAALLAGIAYYFLQKPPPKKRAVKPKPPAEPKMVPVTKTKMVPVTMPATYAAPVSYAQASYPTTASYAAPTTYAAPYASTSFTAPTTYITQ